ncbi:MAG: glycosyltransferase, partial [Nitrososphaerales archaeon]
PMRHDLETEAKALCISDRTRFLGFINQSGLPSVYCGSDLLVLPSEYEPFGVVVNEMMLCGHGAIVSDRVGARFDLIREGETGFVFPCGNIDALAKLLRDTLSNREDLRRYGEAAKRRVMEWSPENYGQGLIEAVRLAIHRRNVSTLPDYSIRA